LLDLKIPKKCHGPHKIPMRVTCGPRVWDPWIRLSSFRTAYVCLSVCCQFSVLIGRWRLLQSGGCHYNQFKILVGTTASQELDARGCRCRCPPCSGNQQWFLCVFGHVLVFC